MKKDEIKIYYATEDGYYEREAKEAAESYKGHEDAEDRYCHKCGKLLKYNSMAYFEGFHFDSCY